MSRSSGFSLIELMIALVVVGIVLTVGLPAFRTYREHMALRQVRAQVLEDVRRARQLAVTRRAPVVMVFGNPPSPANATSYSIHVDTNADNVRQSTEMMTIRNVPRGTRVQHMWLTPLDSLSFDISGVLRPVTSGTPGGSLVLMNSSGQRDTLVISAAGVCYRP